MPPRPEGHRWHIFSQLVFATYGDLCVVCSHGGARHVDHLESMTEHPELAWDLRNCRPVHGSPRNPCLVCTMQAGKRIYCNQIKGGYSAERARRILAEKIAGGTPRAKPTPRVREAPGRDW